MTKQIFEASQIGSEFAVYLPPSQETKARGFLSLVFPRQAFLAVTPM
jgi:hypothetical protein